MPLLGDGPIWHYYKQIYTTPCQNNILPSLLFYSNFANSLDDVVSALLFWKFDINFKLFFL